MYSLHIHPTLSSIGPHYQLTRCTTRMRQLLECSPLTRNCIWQRRLIWPSDSLHSALCSRPPIKVLYIQSDTGPNIMAHAAAAAVRGTNEPAFLPAFSYSSLITNLTARLRYLSGMVTEVCPTDSTPPNRHINRSTMLL
jgi:hypothetical protein